VKVRVLVTLGILLGLTISVRGQDYVATDLGTLGGEFGTQAAAINNSGVIVGGSTEADNVGVLPFRYEDGVMISLGTLGGGGGLANAINNRGQIVGSAQTENNFENHAFIYYKGILTDLGINSVNSNAYGINDSGTITGQYVDGNGLLRGFSYSDGELTDLGTLGGTFTQAYAINASGQIAGHSETPTAVHAFFYDDGVMYDVGTLGGNFSTANAINNQGLVIGSATLPGDTDLHAIGYIDGTIFDLGTLGGFSVALGVNERGDAVGASFAAPGDFTDLRPVLYTDGEVVDLSSYLPGWTSTFAKSINAKGEIAGDGYNPDGNYHAFLLTPTH